MCSSPNLRLREKRQSNSKNTRISRDNKKNSLKIMKSRISSSRNKMSNSTRHFLKESLASESKQSTGSHSTMRWRGNTPTSKVSLRKKRLSGKANLISSRSKRIKLRRTTRTLSASSNRQQTNSKDPKTKARPSTSTTITQYFSSLSQNSRRS